MFRSSWLRWLVRGLPPNRNGQTRLLQPPARRPSCLTLERLEDRTLPSSVTASTVTDLIADIKAANLAGGANTITLSPGTKFTLTAVDNTTDGATGLPVIAANDTLTITGNGDTIERSTVAATPAFRLLDVAAGASLTLNNLTLQGGLAFGDGVSAEGGAIYNQGTLLLNGVTVQNNTAEGYSGIAGGFASGGGIYSNGSMTLQGCTIRNNQAIGGDGRSILGGPGNGVGGGVIVAGGTASLFSTTVEQNTAKGGKGFRTETGMGVGGGLVISSLAAVGLDAFTVAHVIKNQASSDYDNIDGSYNTLP
jgi:hypothetical protein